jgi:polyribonucleotide nucleotidyltransferase
MNATTQSAEFAPGKTLTLETGKLAKQADGAIVVRQGDTTVLCTAVMSPDVRPGQNFFPLTVDYREKFAAGGKIPGGFIKREGRPTDKEVLSSRLVDRSLRPLFPEGMFNEVQIIVSVMSADPDVDADVLAGTGASAALMIGGAPFNGPIAQVRIGRVDGEFIVNPRISQLKESDFDLVVSGKQDAIVMVEGEMKEVSEEDMLEALSVAHEAIRTLCKLQLDLVEAHGAKEPFAFEQVGLPDGVLERVRGIVTEDLKTLLRADYQKATFYGGVADIKKKAVAELLGEGEDAREATDEGWTAPDIKAAVTHVETDVMRDMVLSEGRRLDGRKLDEIRQIWCEVDYLPRVHGSGLFTRGETQVLSTVTLGTAKDAQGVDQVFDQTDKRFFLHYSFPPFSTGEAKFLRGASRREIGHGYLAERALSSMIPSDEEFPYTIRINSDVLESNGSSSMASVCSGSMALMDAGVPIEKAVAGIAMGLITDGERTAVLSDILGTEDHLGDMDFKLTGTRDGITACQMDIKVAGISAETMKTALEQARRGREHILDKMEEAISEANESLKEYAPRLIQITIDADQIGAVIGPGGKVIQGIQKETGTSINIDERDGMGFVTIAASDGQQSDAAIAMIKGIVAKPEPGEKYTGTVKSLLGFGAILEILPGKEAMLHVSEMAYGYVEKPEDHMQVGDKVEVQVIEVRGDGKVRVSRKPFLEMPEGYEEEERKREERRSQRRSNGGDGGGRGRSRGRGRD